MTIQTTTIDTTPSKLQQFIKYKRLAQNTQRHYKSAVVAYEELNQMTLDNLIEEADREEEERIRWKNRKLYKRLIEFRNYLLDTKSQGTANRYFDDIKTIYRHFGIEITHLPTVKSKQNHTPRMKYSDLLTKQEMIDAYHEANNVTKCIILFALSTGFSKIEIIDMTVSDFLDGCTHIIDTSETILCNLQNLKKENELIPCFEGERKKTNIPYITFCSPEASEHIIQYLIGRDAQIKEDYARLQDEYMMCQEQTEKRSLKQKLDTHPVQLERDHKLFDISYNHLSYVFRKINTKLNMGNLSNGTSRFRCHMLRKSHASILLNCKEVTWTVEEIDTLQGRTMDKTHRAYFNNNCEKLFDKYYESVDELMLFKSIHIDKEKFKKLKTENNFYKKEIVKNERKMEEQEETINKIVENQKKLESLLGL